MREKGEWENKSELNIYEKKFIWPLAKMTICEVYISRDRFQIEFAIFMKILSLRFLCK